MDSEARKKLDDANQVDFDDDDDPSRHFKQLGKASKPSVTESVRKGGGVPPLSVNFFPFGFWEPTVR